MSTVLQKDLKMSPFMHVMKQHLSAQIVDKQLQKSQILFSRILDGMLPNLVFSDEKKFDVEHHFNTQNNWVWSRDGEEPAKLTRSHPHWHIVALGTEALQKTSLVFFSRTSHHHIGQKRLRSGFLRISWTLFPKRNGPHLILI